METLAHAPDIVQGASPFYKVMSTKLIVSFFIVGMLLFISRPSIQNRKSAIEN